MKFQKELDFARSVAMHAGELALGYQRQGLKAESKMDLSPVTIADRECERMIAHRIEEAFPGDGILGEEGSSKASKNGRLWIVDPIDGTRDFVRGLPYWSVLIGFEANEEIEVGVSHMAALNAMYSAAKGAGTWRNDQRISVSQIDTPGQSLACVNGLVRINEYPWSENLVEWLSQFWAVRSLGGCMDAMMLAEGRAELWLEAHAAPWDLAPLKVILEEAGASFFNFNGGSSIRGGNCMACVPALEGVARKLVGLPV
ncbi:MAG: inositol monophosphatase family protein [Bryobacteraceae bacterium]